MLLMQVYVSFSRAKGSGLFSFWLGWLVWPPAAPAGIADNRFPRGKAGLTIVAALDDMVGNAWQIKT
jgi:hypothetical protein